MSSEKYTNNANSTLNGGINNSVTSLVVASASLFPATGQFAIIVDAEIMLVTAVSTNTFTITRGAEGTTATSHTSGAIISQILTKRSLDQIISDNCQEGTYSGLPSAEKAGRLYFTTDGVVIFKDTGSTWNAYKNKKIIIPPLSSAFTWDNQNVATITDNVGTLYLQSDCNTFNVLSGMYKTAPSVPYTLTVGIESDLAQQNFSGYGLFFRESSSGKLHVASIQYVSGLAFYSRKYTTSNSFSADYNNYASPQLKWLRLQDDNTNRIISGSMDGINWKVLHSIGRTDFLTANQIGFCMMTEKGSGLTTLTQGLTIYSWLES